jgi:hypothetical protein
LDAYRGAPARRTDDGAVTPEEVASIVASGRAVTTVPEIVAVPFAHLGIRAIPLIDAEPAVLTLVWPEGGATPLVADLAVLARGVYDEETLGASARKSPGPAVDHTSGEPRPR